MSLTEQRSFSFRSRPIHHSGYERKDGDFYTTPAWVTQACREREPGRPPAVLFAG